MKMVFGNGRVFGSGSAAGPGTLEEMLEAGCAMNQAQGPVWLDFGRVITGAQGTLAAVCWASVKVRPIGSCRTMTYVQSDDIGVLGTYASQVIRRRLGEEAVILNKKGLQVILGIDAAAAAEMPEWTYLSSVRGFRFFPEEYMNNQIEDMAEIAGKYGLKLATDINGISSEDAYKALDGHSAKGDFWKLRGGEKIVDLFMINTIGKIEKFERIAAGAVKLAGLNPEDLIVYAQPSQMARNCHIEFLIPAGEKAAELEKSMGMALLDNKAFYSRPYGSMEPEIYEKYKNQRHYMPAIKAVFDAKGIMNPGKLEDGYKGGEI